MAKVTDFGIAKAVSNSTITAFGTTIGSVHYFSPEHAKGGYTDAKSDLYSLGVVMYEMLTGRVPFDADTPVSVALMQVQDEPIEPRKINPQIPISVDHIILKAMQKDPKDRYASATDMLIDLSTSLKRPDDDFVVFSNEPNDIQSERLSSMYDRDEDAEDDEEEEDEMPQRKKKSKGGVFGFFKRHIIITVMLLGILVFGLAFGGTLLFMNLGKDEEAYIPNLVTNESGERMTLEEAQKVFDETAFESKLKVEYEINDEVEVGYVIRQNPEYSKINNMKKKLNTEFTVYVSKAKEEFEIPKNEDVVGKSQEDVEAMLEEIGFTNVTIEQEVDEKGKLKEGLVIRIEPEGKKVSFDTEIKVVVSMGDGTMDVPDVTGKTSKDAQTELKDAGFKVKVKETADKNEEDGIVLKQDKKKAKEGDTITITVNKIPKEVTGTVIVDVASLTGYQPEVGEDGVSVPPEKVTVNVYVFDEEGNELVNSTRSIAENTTDHTVTFKGTGKVTVQVTIGDGSPIFSDTMDLSTTKSITAK